MSRSHERSVRGTALGVGLQQLVRRGLRGVWTRGEMPGGAFVWAANHHSWWDGFVAGAVLHEKQRPAALLMDAVNLESFGFLRSVAVLPTDRPREALQALWDGQVLVVFPEGELRPPAGLATLARGAAWLARRAAVPLIPVAVRVVARGHQYPEAYVAFGAPSTEDSLAVDLGNGLGLLDKELADADPRRPPAGFELAVPGRRSWDERIARLTRKAVP